MSQYVMLFRDAMKKPELNFKCYFFIRNVNIMLRNTNHVSTKIKNIFEKTDITVIGIH